MRAEERQPVSADQLSRRTLFGAAAGFAAAPAVAQAAVSPSSADFERAIAEAERLEEIGSRASRAVSAAGGSTEEADAASEAYWRPANEMVDWVLKTPPTCAKGAAVKLRKAIEMTARMDGGDSVEGMCMRSVLAWVETL